MADGDPTKKPPGTKRIVTGTSKTATPKRIPAPQPRRPAPEEPVVEVVVASGEHAIPATPERVASERAVKGLSVRWKIVGAMAIVTVVTAILIFFVVYSRAAKQLDAEIDAKGVRLCNLLASIDPDYWNLPFEKMAVNKEDLDKFVQVLAKATGKDESEVLKKIYDRGPMEDMYKRVLGLSDDAKLKFMLANAEVDPLLDKALDGADWRKALATLEPKDDPVKWQKFYDAIRERELFEKKRLAPLASFKRGKDDNIDVINIFVKTPRGSLIANEDAKEFKIGKGSEKLENGKVLKGDDVPYRAGVRARSFYTQSDDKKTEYYVLLSLAQIDDAKGDLKTAIFLPILIAVIAGVGIAIWISTLITAPLNRLMTDIDTVSQGDLDHETVPSSKDEIGLLATTFNRMTGALKVAHEAELEQKKLEHQLGIAREIQENLMPKRILRIPGYDVGAFYRPSQEVGGDYYDFIEVDEDHAGIIVADVSGKGVPGAIVMSMALAFIREEVDRTHNVSPMATLTRANRMLAQNIKKGMFVTALYCILDKKTARLSVSSAGHNPLIVWRAATNAVELVNPSGIALGFDKGPVFERTVKEESVLLGHGDRIVAYTDGTVEAMNEADEEFGDKEFFQLAQQLATRDSNQFLNLIVKKLDEHKGNAPQHDDMTIVTLRYL